MDITPFLDKTSKTPLYEQLYTYFKQEMSHARITKGMRLPSKRRLSGLLGVSTATVERAYEQLTAEGYVKSKPKIGWFAADIEPEFPAAPVSYQPPPQSVTHKEMNLLLTFIKEMSIRSTFPLTLGEKA